MKRLFITATDTDAGKTLISQALLAGLANKGFNCIGFKPIAAGCDTVNGDVVNEDALALQNAANIKTPYSLVNPFKYIPPIAPHIAAQLVNESITQSGLDNALMCIKQFAQDNKTDVLLTEGAGGWLLPLNENESLAEWVNSHQMDVVIVVGMKLGCLNHALLTYQSIKQMGLNIVGWVANQAVIDEMPYLAENIAHLKAQFDCPYLGYVPFIQDEISKHKVCLAHLNLTYLY